MEIDKQIIREHVLKQNLRRFLIMPLVSIPINIGHILFFSFIKPDAGSPEYEWYQGIIASHSVLALIALLMLVLAFSRKKLSLPGDSFTWLFFHTIILLIILTGVAITITDQIVTPSITPLLITYVTVSVVFLIHPRNSIILFLIAFGLFFFLMPYTQANAEILLSNRLNGLTAMGLAYIISVILWKNNWSGIAQTIIIEEQKKVLEINNQELLTQTKSLNEINATKNKLFSIIAHDLRNPFSNIIGFSELLQDELDSLDTNEIKTFASHINNSANQTLKLLDNLLEWTRMQQGKIVFSPATLDLKQLSEEVMHLLSDRAQKKNIRLVNLIAADMKLIADAEMLKAILRNLLSNAVKFTRQGGKVEISAKEYEHETLVTVTDNGIGINKEDIKKLFSAATNFTIRGTENETGTGLGLVLCRDFIEKHGGRIWVESKVEAGSSFTFSIPAPDKRNA
jgi:signal transduction histidine kinase